MPPGRRGYARSMRAAVAATDSWVDEHGLTVPAGHVHAWLPGTSQTLCGLSTESSRLGQFSHIDWADVRPASGRDANRVAALCPKCTGAMGRRRDPKSWTRAFPRQWNPRRMP